MKSYRYVVLVVLVAVVLGGWVSLFRSNEAIEAEYQAHLADARAAAEIGVTLEVQKSFGAALAIRATPEVSLELADYLRDNADSDVYEDELERFITRHPDRAEGYERLAEIYIGDEEYGEAFDVLDKASAEEIASPTLDSQYDSIAYRYVVSGSSYPEVTPFTADDVAAVRVDTSWRFVRADGQVIEGSFDEAGAFWGGRGPVVVDGLAQYVDEKGKTANVATRLDHESYGILAEGLIPARTSAGTSTFLTESFRPASFAGTYDYASSFVGGRAAVSTAEGWSVLDTTGTVVGEGYTEVAVDDAGIVVGQERYFAKTDGAFRLYDLDGAQVGDATFEDARPFGPAGFAAVQISGSWGFVDAAGAVRIPPSFEDADSFSHGLAAVQVDGSWGYVDDAGTLVVPATFAGATRFSSEGTALVATPAETSAPALAPEPGTEPAPEQAPGGDIVWRLLELVRYQE